MKPSRSSWARHLDAVGWLGPGFVLAATAIGASHLVLSPTAGAAFGYTLLWVVLFSHAVKYPAFEFGPRFAVATGTSLLDGYARVPGPRGWALWVFLLGTVVQGVTVLAGVLGVASAVAAAAWPVPGIAGWSLILGLVIALLLATGGFDGLSALSKWMLLGLAVMTAFAFASRLPGPDFWPGAVRPRIPAGSVLLVAALLGWMPTGIDVSVWHSMWALERRDAWRERALRRGNLQTGAAGTYAVARLDLNLGYGLSLVLAVLLLGLGAEVLRPAGIVPEGAGVAIAIARLYTGTLGEWAMPVFLVAAFFGMFSTAYGVMDGFPRAFAGTVGRLAGGARSGGSTHRRPPPSRGRLYWGFLSVSLVLAVAETLVVADPVVLVTIAAVVSFLLAPALFALNHYCVTRLIEQPALRPGRMLRLWSRLGIAGVLGATCFFLYVQFVA